MLLVTSRFRKTTFGAAAIGWLVMALPVNAGPPDAPQVPIKDFMFQPMSLKIKVGSTVTWANKDDEPHSVVSDAGMFKSGGLDTAETFSFKFDKPGTYQYHCSIHPRMIGTIVVE